MSCVSNSVALPDELGQTWALSLAVGGQLQTTLIPSNGVPAAPILKPLSGPDAPGWSLRALSNGFLQTQKVASPGNVPNKLQFLPGDSTRWWLYVDTNGTLYTVQVSNGASGVVVGQLHPNSESFPPAQQPGGIGTPVTSPKQQIGNSGGQKPDSLFPINEFNGRFRAGCGHSFNSYEIRKELVSGCDASALIVCPLCIFIQKIVTPYDLIHDPLQYPYIVG